MSDYTEITTQQAHEWLAVPGPRRRLSQTRVNSYARDMAAGKWVAEVAPPIVLDKKTGAVLDGQHRLAALTTLSDSVRLRSVVVRADSSSVLVMDIGRPRSLQNTLEILGHENAKYKSAFLNTAHFWARNMRSGTVMSRAEQVQWLNSNPNTEKATTAAQGMHRLRAHQKRVYVPSGVVATLWDIAEYAHGGATVEEFVQTVEFDEADSESLLGRLSSLMLDAKNPKTRTKITHDQLSYMIARCYVAWLDDADLQKLYTRRAAVIELPGYGEWMSVNWDSHR